MSELQTLLTDLAFPESPRWHEGRLWLSDWGAQEVIAVDLAGKRQVITTVQAFPFCFDFLPDGRLLVIENQQILRQEADGTMTPYANLADLSAYSWNEIVVDRRGNAYLNNIGFDFPEGAFAPGFIALVTPDGVARQVADGVAFPNGMVVTPDNTTLIVAESYGKQLTAFDIAPDGSLANRRVWAGLGDGTPDGICLDAENAIWYADVPNQCCVRVREGGEVLQTIQVDRGCFVCALGGANGRTLFMVANEWDDETDVAEKARKGLVFTAEAPARSAGWRDSL